MAEGEQDFGERIARRVSTIFVALLFCFFAYAYLSPIVLR